MKKKTSVVVSLLLAMILCIAPFSVFATETTENDVSDKTAITSVYVGGNKIENINAFVFSNKQNELWVSNYSEVAKIFPAECPNLAVIPVEGEALVNPFAEGFGYTIVVASPYAFIIKEGNQDNDSSFTSFYANIFVDGVEIPDLAAKVDGEKVSLSSYSSLAKIFTECADLAFVTSLEEVSLNDWAETLGYDLEIKVESQKVYLTKKSQTPEEPELPEEPNVTYLYINGVKSDISVTKRNEKYYISRKDFYTIFPNAYSDYELIELSGVVQFFGYSFTESNTCIFINNDGSIPIGIKLEGKFIPFTKYHPYARDNRTMVPLRNLSEELGFTVTWNKESNSVSITKDTKNILLFFDSTHYYVNGNEKTMDVLPYVVDGTTFVPVRFVAEGLGYKVDYHAIPQPNKLNEVWLTSSKI